MNTIQTDNRSRTAAIWTACRLLVIVLVGGNASYSQAADPLVIDAKSGKVTIGTTLEVTGPLRGETVEASGSMTTPTLDAEGAIKAKTLEATDSITARKVKTKTLEATDSITTQRIETLMLKADVVTINSLSVLKGSVSMFGERTFLKDGEKTPADDAYLLVEQDAASDGFVVGMLAYEANNSACWIEGLVDGRVMATAAMNATNNIDVPIYRASFTMPVRKGEKWNVMFRKKAPHSAAQKYSIYWIPLGR